MTEERPLIKSDTLLSDTCYQAVIRRVSRFEPSSLVSSRVAKYEVFPFHFHQYVVPVPDDLIQYYSDRAGEYEAIYDIPSAQDDYEWLTNQLQTRFTDRDVIEIACGTGYWTRRLAESAARVFGVDASRTVLQRAQAASSAGDVAFLQADAYSIDCFDHSFSGGFTGFWLSHVPVDRRRSFFAVLHSVLAPDAQICFFDNRPVDEFTIDATDAAGNTYQTRELQDGREYTILKNFLTESTLREMLAPYTTAIEYKELEYLWFVSYTRE